MGYCMEQLNSKFKIKKANKAKALEALKKISTRTNEMGGGSSSGQKWFSWVDMEYVNKPTLEEALVCWRWHSKLDKKGNVVDIWFEGEKLGNDLFLFETLAPFVEQGSFIEMSGEDGAMWRWTFKNKKCKEISPKITW